MRNITGQAVIGDNLYGREYELNRLWEMLEQGEHILMLAPRRVGKTSLMLELRRAPRENWDVFYIDVEACKGAADCMAVILAALAADPRYRSRFDAIPFSNAIRDVVGRISASTDVGPLHVELETAIGREWDRAAMQLQDRLTTLPDTDGHVLIILDELPFLLARMLRTPGQENDAELLLSRFRAWRQAPDLRGRVHTLVGGSIGLEGVLRRARLSGSVNDLTPFRLDSWDRHTARAFVKELGPDQDFELDDSAVTRILDLLGDPVPYHVQLFFSALRDACRGDPEMISLQTIEECFTERLAGPSGTTHLDHYATRLEIAFNGGELEMALSILGRVCQREDGIGLVKLNDLLRRSKTTFQLVLRDLEIDGYVRREQDRLQFRSNLLRQWWTRHHGTDHAP